ncbi:MAG: hypothetical protein A2Y25_04945 [Candidatus Melainabacteria bacterium GWF2_37_15]|nr:MAG: hypothetical protein A2Y25_04945 [Candidatus Melainabacteria bacterium GWF2_37_15]
MFKNLLIVIGLIITLFINNVRVGAEEVKEVEEAPPLKGSVSVINVKSDKIKYYPEKDQFVATGNVVINVEDKKTIIESDEVILDQTNQVIISEKNVKITKQGTVVYGDYARFDLTKDSALISQPDADLAQIKIEAKTAEVVSDDLELLQGKATFKDKNMVIPLSTGTFSGSGGNRLFQSRTNVEPRLKYDVKAKEVMVETHENYNVITLKNASISINKFPIAKVPVLQIVKDAETSRIETMFPEFGHEKEIGAYIGHGHVFLMPSGSTLKALPVFAWGDGGVGVGGMGRYMSRTNKTEVLYSTIHNRFSIHGEQDFNLISPDTIIQYGTNAFFDNGFFGEQKPQYLLEVVDNRKITEAYNCQFLLRSSAGFAEELGNFSTGKFQLQGTIANIEPIFNYKDYLRLGIESNFAISAYGTGDTYGVARIGPTIASNLGRVNLWAAYYQGGVYGKTPFFYDQYLYGKSNVVFNGNVKITKYLSMGYLTSLNLTKDNWQNEMVTENQIFAWIGPDDLKLKVGYDVERQRPVWGFDMLLGSDTSAFNFEKLKVKQR